MSVMQRFQARKREEGRVLATMPVAPAQGTGKVKAPKVGAVTQGLLALQQLVAFLTAALVEDLAMLSGITSKERKAEVKRDNLLPKYEQYVERLQEAVCQHELVGYYLVWLFDVGLVEKALQLGFWCIQHGQALPERFNSKVPFFIASQVIDWAEKEFDAGRSPDPYFSDVFALLNDSEQQDTWDVPDKLRARYHRLCGLDNEKAGHLEHAKLHLHRAYELGAQVKTHFTRVEAALAKAAAEGTDKVSE